ncbi:MAG: DUF1499 domain-containing protein [Elusimicrobia bacterium]|nr:DUF1499 domain-containing protein [Elusimicrobiota bacterium]
MKALLLLAATLAAAGTKQFGPFGPGEAGRCGRRPNCVSTLDDRKRRRMEPWAYEGSREDAQRRLEQAVQGELADARPGYLHAEFRSKLWKFVDDVEFWLPEHERVIHFRSASRTGWSDFGANRRRMQRLAERFAGKAP